MLTTSPTATVHPIRQQVTKRCVCRKGGQVHTRESKAKISRARKGCVPWNKGKQLSKETREKIAESLRHRMADPKVYKVGCVAWSHSTFVRLELHVERDNWEIFVHLSIDGEYREQVWIRIPQRRDAKVLYPIPFVVLPYRMRIVGYF